MKSLNYIKGLTLALLLPASVSFGQFVDVVPETGGGGGGFMVGEWVEVGINWGGHEGTWNEGAPWSPNSRGAAFNAEVEHGFVSNPAMDGWGDYDGDFFSPGTPENGFGLELGGVNYSNNANNADWSDPDPTQEEIPGDIMGFDIVGDCMEIQWQGTINGIQVDVVYQLTYSELYYTTKVTLTNTNAVDELDVYYYRNLDPDNNQTIGWSFTTVNTIQANPDPDCDIALVSAEQFNTWDNYFGLGAIGPNFRATYGGFTNRDASDIWNEVAPFEQTVGATITADQGISLAYYIDNLEAGTSETFQFAVIMSSDDVDAALSNLYYFDYADGGGIIDECAPVVDTVEICPGEPVEITVDGPNADEYDWLWSPPDGLSTTVGPTTTASPLVSTEYTVVGTPVSACLSSSIEKTIYVDVVSPPAGPDSSGLICNTVFDLDVNDYLAVGVGGAGGLWSEISTAPSGTFDGATGVFDASGQDAGAYVFEFIAFGEDGCPNDTMLVTIDVEEAVTAGADNAAPICNDDGFMIDVDGLLLGADEGGFWEATTVAPTFSTTTAEFNVDGITGGDYTFEYIVEAEAPCQNDTAVFTITVNEIPPVVAPDDFELCELESTVLVGAGGIPGTVYTWDNGVTDGLQFNPAVGSLTYTVLATDPNGCVNTDEVMVTVHPKPVVTFYADEISGCTPHEVNFFGTSSTEVDHCSWNFGNSSGSKDCHETSFTYENEGLYDVTYFVMDVNGCFNQATIDEYIFVDQTPVASFNFNPTTDLFVWDTQVCFDNTSTDADTYEWIFGGSSETFTTEDICYSFPDATGNQVYDAILTVSNSLGCTDVATATFDVKDPVIFYVPNIFTPDGDDFNETFQPVFNNGVNPYSFHMTIFNRYGEIVFESYNYDQGWDGTYGSQGLVQDGTYIWQIEFLENESDKKHKHQGHVTILR